MKTKLIEKQGKIFSISVNDIPFTFMPPLSLFRDSRFLPIPLIIKGITPGWRVSSKNFLSYKQFKEIIIHS